jgi:heme-degrading monooxygenase HmoA
MFARHVTLKLKTNFARDFPVVFEKEILPLIRKQKGFLDEMLLVTPEKWEVVAISLWEEKEHAEIYNRETYPQVLNILGKYIESTPVVKPFEVQYSTFHKIAIPATA